MSVKKLDFRHMSHLSFPSASARSTREWRHSLSPVSSGGDGDLTVDVPSLVLMENMERTGAEVVFAAFKTLDDAFNGGEEKRPGDLVVDSKVAFVSMRSEHVPLLPEPVKLTFAHGSGGGGDASRSSSQRPPWPVARRTCAHWDSGTHEWSRRGCRTLGSNSTHTHCACAHFGMVALLGEVADAAAGGDGEEGGGGAAAAAVAAVVAAAVVIFCVIVSAAVGADYLRRVRPVSGTSLMICTCSCKLIFPSDAGRPPEVAAKLVPEVPSAPALLLSPGVLVDLSDGDPRQEPLRPFFLNGGRRRRRQHQRRLPDAHPRAI